MSRTFVDMHVIRRRVSVRRTLRPVMEEEIVTNTDLNQSQQNMTAIQSVGMPMHSSSKEDGGARGAPHRLV